MRGEGRSNMATALELGATGWRDYVEGARRRLGAAAVSRGDDGEAERLWARLREVATTLRLEFGASRVLVFGSLARGVWHPTTSDVDVAVEGLRGDYWKAWGVVEDAVGDHRVDLVEMETVSQPLRDAIDDEGVEV